jgi:hypothetical protein
MVITDITNLYFTAAKKWGRKLNYELITKKLMEENDDIGVMNGYASFRRHYAPFLTVLSNLGYSIQHKMIDAFLPHPGRSGSLPVKFLSESFSTPGNAVALPVILSITMPQALSTIPGFTLTIPLVTVLVGGTDTFEPTVNELP